ncbi:uncharacterized protein LY89DRAFT_738954 [Mollisia scopiformis]|uniref:Phosphatidic acid phosphatase type 2/haloperoxidase domain-containing protein n=1 Tax=Mollisia scopiformis TaxID=149040 RepID=A0A194WU83_MOLSC|nr:uncharacterized protein LY89DRAFT_738954 [Mollisia scopiformis]KUJ11521.1 hypothetical protein LY89DRAFT_738954 [Mollisia scopiformis]
MASRQLIKHATDWAVILISIIAALLLSDVNPDFHTFCVLDMNLSYPFRPSKLSLPVFILLSIILPVITIILVTIFTPFPSIQNSERNSRARIRKLRSLNAALLGLGVSLGTSTVVFTGVKSLTGKPRPNMLSICDPDLENIVKYTVGGVGVEFNRLWVMVTLDICRQRDTAALRDAFRSFPSGYATIAFAGLWYLSLFLCHRFGVEILPSSSPRNIQNIPRLENDEQHEPLLPSEAQLNDRASRPDSNQLEALPVYKLLLPYVPLGLAIFIAGTRYFDFRNHGFDVLAGAFVGSVTSYVGFKMYSTGNLLT